MMQHMAVYWMTWKCIHIGDIRKLKKQGQYVAYEKQEKGDYIFMMDNIQIAQEETWLA